MLSQDGVDLECDVLLSAADDVLQVDLLLLRDADGHEPRLAILDDQNLVVVDDQELGLVDVKIAEVGNVDFEHEALVDVVVHVQVAVDQDSHHGLLRVAGADELLDELVGSVEVEVVHDAEGPIVDQVGSLDVVRVQLGKMANDLEAVLDLLRVDLDLVLVELEEDHRVRQDLLDEHVQLPHLLVSDLGRALLAAEELVLVNHEVHLPLGDVLHELLGGLAD